MSNLCIVFPGRRYSTDRSLLYFPSSLIRSLGYQMIYLHYDVYKETQDMKSIEENIKDAKIYTDNQLEDVDFSKYEKIIFLSKSIGTIVSSQIIEEHKLTNVNQILITPLPLTIPYIQNNDLIICGDKDSYFPNAKEQLASFPNTYIFPSFTHSLETKDNYRLTLKTLLDVTSIVDMYLKSIKA